MTLRPYLFMNGRCAEAVAFYQEALGARVAMSLRFADAPPEARSPDPALAEKIMHVTLEIGGATLFLSDGMGHGEAKFEGFGVSLDAPDDETVDRHCAALAEGGTVQHPPGPTFFAARFGMARDKFGVLWMIMHENR